MIQRGKVREEGRAERHKNSAFICLLSSNLSPSLFSDEMTAPRCVYVCDDAVTRLLYVCVCLSAFASVSLCMYPIQPSMNICLTGERSLGALEPKLPKLHFVRGAEDLNASPRRAGVSHAELCNLFAVLGGGCKKSHCLQASLSAAAM